MHIAEVVTIAKSLPLLRLNTYKSLILSYSADYRRILIKKQGESPILSSRNRKIMQEQTSLNLAKNKKSLVFQKLTLIPWRFHQHLFLLQLIIDILC